MAKQQKFYLDDEKTQEVIVSWTGIWKNISVTHNGNVIGGFENFKALKEGNTFTLNDGSPLEIYWSTSYGDQGLRLSRLGRPLKGTSGDPETKLKGIFGIACFIGGLNFILGAIGQFGDVEFLDEMGANWVLMVIGTLIIGLGYLTMKQKSAIALTAIILLISADVLLTLFMSLDSSGRFSITGVGLKVIFIIQFARGYKAIREYQDAKIIEGRQVGVNPFQ